MKNHLKNFLLGGLGGITAALAAIGLKHLRASNANEPSDDERDDATGDSRNGHSHRPFYLYGRSSRHSSHPRPALSAVQRHAPGRYYHRGDR